MPHECLAIIESKSKVHYLRNKPFVAKVSTNTSSSGISPDVAELKDMVKALLFDKKSQNQAPATVKAIEESCVTCGGAHSYRNCPATDGNINCENSQEFVSQAFAVNYNQGNTSYRPPMMNNQNHFNQNQNQGNNFNHGPVYQPPVFQPPAYQAPVYQAPAPQTQGVSKEDFSAYIKANDAVMRNMQTQENKPEATKDTVNPTNNGSTKDVQPQVVQSKSLILTSELVNSPTIEPVNSPVSATRPNLRPSIPYPSRMQDQKLRDKANVQREKFFQIFKDLNFNISFADALILMPKFGPSIKNWLTNKDKLCELARTPPNEHCSAVLLKKFPEKLRDPGKFLIPCDFPGKAECLALADLSASINLMPLSVWNKLSLPDLTPMCMTLELTDRSISRPVGVAEDVYVKVGELTLRVGKEAITFNLDRTSRYSANYSDMTAKRIDVIGMACEEYSQEVLGFSDVISSANPTPYYDPMVSTTSPTLTAFENSDFLLEEVDAFLAIEDDLLHRKNYLPEVRKELKICEAKSDKSLIDEPLEVELKDLPPHLEYAFLEGDDKLPVIIEKYLSVPWVSPVHCVPKKGNFTVVGNEDNELIPTRLVMGWRVCINYRKLNEATRKDHFPLPFMDQMLERLAGNQYYCFLDGFSGYFQIPIDPKDQEKTTFTCPYGTFAYRRMSFGLCNAQGTFQRCMMAIFHDMIEKTMEVFMDDFSVFENSFQSCLSHLERMLKRCEDTNLCLNWEKSHFMVKEGIVFDHKISKQWIKVDKSKVDIITKLPHPTIVKGIQSFLGHTGFYRRFIKDFSKIARLMTRLLEKDTAFIFSKECVEAFQTLKRKLTEAPILIAPNWDMPFELMCDASDFAIRAVLGQRQDKHFRPIHYASKTMTKAESNYTTTKKEMLAVVYAFEKFWSYLIMNKSIVYTDHFALKYLFAKKDSKARLLR
nr:reverse transcriptase domain-containing protein [Tanacetum cinerariifolium]